MNNIVKVGKFNVCEKSLFANAVIHYVCGNLMYCGVSFLASSNLGYYYGNSSSNRLSAGVIAGIAVGGILLFF